MFLVVLVFVGSFASCICRCLESSRGLYVLLPHRTPPTPLVLLGPTHLTLTLTLTLTRPRPTHPRPPLLSSFVLPRARASGNAHRHHITATAKVQRFSPQDLMALRRAPTRPLGKMPILGADISVIVSEEPLEPVTATPADEEAISKVQQASRVSSLIFNIMQVMRYDTVEVYIYFEICVYASVVV